MNVNYIIKSLENLNEYEQHQVFNFLKRGLKKIGLHQVKYALIVKVIMYQEMVSIMVNKDTYVSLVIKHLLILHSLLAITLKKTFRNG